MQKNEKYKNDKYAIIKVLHRALLTSFSFLCWLAFPQDAIKGNTHIEREREREREKASQIPGERERMYCRRKNSIKN